MKNKGISHPFSYSFACPRQGIKNATGLCYPWRCPGRWPVCIQLYGHGAEAPIDGCCTHISAFRGLSACQGSLNSSKIVVNEMVLTCLKCPWIQCFQGIIRFWLDFSCLKYSAISVPLPPTALERITTQAISTSGISSICVYNGT